MKASEPSARSETDPGVPAATVPWKVLACGFIGAGLGALALVGWIAGLPLLASWGPDNVAMLPATATALGLLGLSLVLIASPVTQRRTAQWAAVLVVPVVLLSFAYLLAYFSGLYYTFLTPHDQWRSGEALPRESPISAACFLIMGLAILFIGLRSSRKPAAPAAGTVVPDEPFFPGGFGAASATVVALVNLIGALGYAYGTPLFYGALIAKTPLPTTLAMLVMSIGLIVVAGPKHWPLRPLSGTSAQAVLLRNFLPVMAAAVLLGGAVDIQLRAHFEYSVLVSALWALIFTGIVTFLVSKIAQEIGAALDAAEQRIEKLNRDLEQRLIELAETNRRLVQQSEENEMFVYSVSHDLRSPLVNLQGFSKELSLASDDIRKILMEASLPEETQKRALDTVDTEMGQSIRFIQTAVMRLASIIDSLLRLSRAGRVELHWTQVDLNSTVARVVEALHSTATERRAQITVNELPAAWGDTTVLEQIFANLIGNALNYLDPERPGRIEVGVRKPPEDAAANAMHTCYVKDNGLGIPQAYQQKVFHAFQRFHADKAKGEGMGLASVRRLVDRHGGKIWFESVAGEGTTFFVSLPVRPIANGAPVVTTGEKGSPAQAHGSKGNDLREVSHPNGRG